MAERLFKEDLQIDWLLEIDNRKIRVCFGYRRAIAGLRNTFGSRDVDVNLDAERKVGFETTVDAGQL